MDLLIRSPRTSLKAPVGHPEPRAKLARRENAAMREEPLGGSESLLRDVEESEEEDRRLTAGRQAVCKAIDIEALTYHLGGKYQ